jgi:hypothetical protein
MLNPFLLAKAGFMKVDALTFMRLWMSEVTTPKAPETKKMTREKKEIKVDEGNKGRRL